MTARTEDYDAIIRIMQWYLDAFNGNDVSRFREAFDEDAWIYYIDADGSLHKRAISEDFERWATPPSWDVVGPFGQNRPVERRAELPVCGRPVNHVITAHGVAAHP